MSNQHSMNPVAQPLPLGALLLRMLVAVPSKRKLVYIHVACQTNMAYTHTNTELCKLRVCTCMYMYIYANTSSQHTQHVPRRSVIMLMFTLCSKVRSVLTTQAQQIHDLAVQIGEKVAKAEALGKYMVSV